MSKRMTTLENLVKDVKEELSKTVEVINRKDDEIEMLKEQLYQQGRQQTSPRLSPAHQTAQEDEYLREQFDKLNEVISNMGPRKERFFFRKGGMISTEDGNCEDKRKHCEKFSNQRTMPSNNCSLHEEMGDNFSINHPPKRNKPNVYKSDIDRMEDENGDVKKILTERGDLGKFSNSNSNSFCDERSNEELEAEYLRLADQVAEMENITYYEAPSANSELTKHIIVGPVESQSEPAISTTSTIPFQRNSQAADHRTYQQQEYRKYSGREGYPQRMNQGGGMDLDFISAGSDGSDDEKPFETTLYDDSYGRNAGAVTAVLDERRDRGHKVVSRKTNESDLEPKLTLLNTRTSDGQIELNLKSYDGNETFCAYINPDDTIGKVWFLTNLNPDEFEVTADDKVLDLNIPLKNYNIDGDVTLNIVKRKSSIIHTQNKLPVTNETNEEGSIDSQEEDDAPPEISIPDDEEGYSS